MATSESEDFESADEDFDKEAETKSKKDEKTTEIKVGHNGGGEGPLKSESPSAKGFSTPVCDDKDTPTTDPTKDNAKEKSEEMESSAEDKEVESVPEPVIVDPDPGEPKKDIPSGRSKRAQQGTPRESKIGQPKGGGKKLGTRVVAPSEDIRTKNLNSEISSSTESRDNTKEESPPKAKSIIDEKPASEPKTESKQFTSVFDKLAAEEPKEESSGWGWGGWSSSLLSTATASVSTLTSHVSQGISTVIETVEGGLGAPDPTELAKQDLEAAQLIASVKEPPPSQAEIEAAEASPSATDTGSSLFPLGQIFSGVSQLGKMVESTGAKVLSGGLDTLEVIGKKTMEVLQEGDPGLKKKRALFQADRPILSQALREARDRAEEEAKLMEEKQAARKVHFETLFDDYQGLIHLEALEMLSRQCEIKLQAALLELMGTQLQQVQTRLQNIRDECLLPDPDDMPDEPRDDIEDSLQSAIKALNIDISAEKLLKTWRQVVNTATSSTKEVEEDLTETIVHQRAIASLAELTSCCVEQFHRAGELLLVHEPRRPEQEAAHLMQITLLESSMVEQLASNFCESLNSFGEPAQPLITKVFLEASNSSTYVQDAFQLLAPVLQVGSLN